MESFSQLSSKWKKTLFFLISLIIVFCGSLLLLKHFSAHVNYNIYSPKYQAVDKLLLKKNLSIEQVIAPNNELKNIETISAVSIQFFVNHQVKNSKPGNIEISLYKNNKLIQSWKQNSQFLRNNVYSTFNLKKSIVLDKKTRYKISIKNIDVPDNKIGLAVAKADKGSFFMIGLSEKKYSSRLCYRVISSRKSTEFATVVTLITGIVALLMIIVAGILKDINSSSESIKNFCIIKLLFCALLFIFLITAILGHGDGRTITTWGLKLLEAVQAGIWREYATYLEKTYYMSNYNVLVNVFNAILMAPLYLVHSVFNIEMNVDIFNWWRCLFTIVFVYITSIFLEKIALLLNYDKQFAKLFGILYLVSPALLCGLGMGQIDCVLCMFLVIAFFNIIQKKYTAAFFWVGTGAIIKEFAILFVFFPWICLVAGDRNIKQTSKYLIVFCILPLISFILSHFVFMQYASLQSIAAIPWNHINKVFRTNWEGTSCFFLVLFVVCLGCIYRSINRKVKIEDWFFAPMIIITAFHMFVMLHPQWEVYVLLLILFGVLFNNCFSFLSIMVSQFGVYLYTLFRFENNVDTTLLKNGIIGKLFSLQNTLTMGDYTRVFFPTYATYLGSVGKTMISAVLIFSVYIFYQKYMDNDIIINYSSSTKVISLVICTLILMNLLAVVTSFIVCFGLVRI